MIFNWRMYRIGTRSTTSGSHGRGRGRCMDDGDRQVENVSIGTRSRSNSRDGSRGSSHRSDPSPQV